MSQHERNRRQFLQNITVLGAGLFAVSGCTDTVSQGASDRDAGSAGIEGGEVVTDLSRFPTSFHEAPEFAQLVHAGKLPPVAERIGEDPLVIKPVRDIGTYGGTLRRGMLGIGD